MSLRLVPWQPEYGTAMQFDADPDDEPSVVPDLHVERPVWAPVTPRVDAPHVRIVDGVRRAEAHALDDDGGAAPAFGLFGSFAVGVVESAPGGARILDEHTRVERRYLTTSTGETPDRELVAGSARLRFVTRGVPGATRANDLVAALNRAMLDEEARLAEALSEDDSVLTLVDGPLRSLRSGGRRVVGYVKRIQQWYVGRGELELLPTLLPGERTPVFAIPPGDDAPAGGHLATGRYSWFVRLPVAGAHLHPLGGVLRLECAADVQVPRAVALADQSAVLLPRLASSPVRDPRAPQNLTPVGALEAHLTHLLGDRAIIQRLIARSVAQEAVAL